LSTRNADGLRRLAVTGRWGCVVAAAVLVAATWAHIWTQPIRELVAPLGFVSLDHVAAWQFALVRVIACGATAAAAASLLGLAACFRAMSTDDPFPATAAALPRFASTVLVALLVSAVTAPLSSLVLSAGADPGQGRVVVTLGANHAFALLATVAFYALARLVREAARIERENAEFV